MYVVYINLLYFLSIFLFTYNKNLLSQKKIQYKKVIKINFVEVKCDVMTECLYSTDIYK